MIGKIKWNFPIFSRQSEYDSEELTALELAGRTANKVNEVVDLANTVDGKIAGKEDSVNITNNRKLSASGNFFGRLLGRAVSSVLIQTDTNRDQLRHMATNFLDGQQGQVIDGGFFEDDGIRKNYDGGMF